MSPEEFIAQEVGESGKQEDGSYQAVWDHEGGCWCIGPGLTRGVVKGTHWSASEVLQNFHKELASFEKGVQSIAIA